MDREDDIDALLAGLKPLLFHEEARVAYLLEEGWPGREIALEVALERRIVIFRRTLSREGLRLSPREAASLASKIRRGCRLDVAVALAQAISARAGESSDGEAARRA